MDMTEYASRAFADILAGCPANGCRAESPRRVDAGASVPGGWSAARRLAEGLYGGRALVNVTQAPVEDVELPAVEVFCDDPVGTAGNFRPEAGVMGVRDADGAWALCCGGPSALAEPLVTVGRASLSAAVLEGASLIPAAVDYLLERGVKPEEILWGWSSAPVVLTALDGERDQAERRAVVGLSLIHI